MIGREPWAYRFFGLKFDYASSLRLDSFFCKDDLSDEIVRSEFRKHNFRLWLFSASLRGATSSRKLMLGKVGRPMEIIQDLLLWLGCAVGFCVGAYLIFAAGFISMFVIGSKKAKGLTTGQAWIEWACELLRIQGASRPARPDAPMAKPPIQARSGKKRGKAKRRH